MAIDRTNRTNDISYIDFFDAYGDGGYSSNNPYANNLATGNYSENVFDQMFGTQEKKIQSAAMDWEAQKSMWDYQFAKTNAYNSPAAQAARMRAAGLNPDLQDISNSNSGASPSGFSAGLAGTQTETGLGVFSSIVGAFKSAIDILGGGIGAAMSAVSAFQDIRGKKLSNDSSELSVANNLVGTAVNYIVSNLGQTVYDSYQSDLQSIASGKELTGNVVVLPETFFDSLGLNKRTNKRLLKIGSDLINKRSPLLMKEIYRNFGDVERFAQDYNTLVGNVMVTDENGNRRPDADVQYFSRNVSEIMLDIWKLKQKYDKDYLRTASGVSKGLRENAENDYNYNYYGSRDGVFRALSENKQYEYDAAYLDELIKNGVPYLEASVKESSLEQLKIATEFNNRVQSVFKKHFTKLSKDLETENNFYTALLISLLARASTVFDDSIPALIKMAATKGK